MTIAHPSTTDLLCPENALELARSHGPCITILLPPFRSGNRRVAPAVRLKAAIDDLARRFQEENMQCEDVARLLRPLEALAGDSELAARSHWSRVIFRSPTIFRSFLIADEEEESVRVAGSFFIRPLIPELYRPAVFHVLAISKTHVSLLRCAGQSAAVVKLPEAVPATLAEALDLEPPDHDLENRSAVGPSVGSMRRMRFGTGSEREKRHAHLADYYKCVDRGLHAVLAGAPLVLCGVDEDSAMYRSVSAYPGLVKESISGSLDFDRDKAEILRKAYLLLRAERDKRELDACLMAREGTAPARYSTDPSAILRAAFDGRVAQLWLSDQSFGVGIFERENYRSWGKEDLLNLAAVQTLAHDGRLAVLSAATVSLGFTAGAVLRF